jgi:hypothetical protein
MKIMKVGLSVIIAVSIVLCSGAFAQYTPEVVRVKGSPKIMKSGMSSWSDCKEGLLLGNGDRIKTAKEDAVTVGFVQDRKNIIKICPDSEAVIASGQEPVYVVDLLSGEAMALLLSLPEKSTFAVKTPTGVSVAKGTGWKSITDGLVSTFEAYDNSIYVKGLYADGTAMDNEIFVDMGYKTVVKKLMQPEPIQRLAPEDIDRWNAWRDELENKEAKSTEVSNQGVLEPSGR